jgi:hypothetical protein
MNKKSLIVIALLIVLLAACGGEPVETPSVPSTMAAPIRVTEVAPTYTPAPTATTEPKTEEVRVDEGDVKVLLLGHEIADDNYTAVEKLHQSVSPSITDTVTIDLGEDYTIEVLPTNVVFSTSLDYVAESTPVTVCGFHDFEDQADITSQYWDYIVLVGQNGRNQYDQPDCSMISNAIHNQELQNLQIWGELSDGYRWFKLVGVGILIDN